LDELLDGKFLGAGVLLEREVSEDGSQGCAGQRVREGSQEIGTQRLTPVREGNPDQTKQPALVALGPG
jgi:hypothetical protein